ncbi:MAG: PD-(D/E)XK nuclease family protein [bacterium]
MGEKIHNFIDIYINTESLSNVLAMLKNVFQVTFRNRSSEIFEFFYEVSVSANEEKEFYERSERALKNFDYYYKQNLKKLKNNIISRDSQGIQSFILDGITVLYKPDLVVKVDDNISIFDWKTFDATSDLNQVDLYILAFHSKGFSNIEFKIVNLSNVNEEVFYTDSERLLKYKEFIKSSFEEIKNFWDELQIFTQKEFDNLFEQIYNNFPKTNDYNLCKRCEFKKLCQR